MRLENHIKHTTGPHKSIELPLDDSTLDEYKARVNSWGVKYNKVMQFSNAVHFQDVIGELNNIPDYVHKCSSFWIYMKK